MTADAICAKARETMVERGKTYDPSGGEERSMPRIVAAFNALTGHNLTETDGWQFMLLLKLVRGRVTPGHADSALDGVAYAALAGESALRMTPNPASAGAAPWCEQTAMEEMQRHLGGQIAAP